MSAAHDDLRVLADALLDDRGADVLADMPRARRHALAEALLRATYGRAWWLAWTVWLGEAVRQRPPVRYVYGIDWGTGESYEMSSYAAPTERRVTPLYADFAEQRHQERQARPHRKREQKRQPRWAKRPRG